MIQTDSDLQSKQHFYHLSVTARLLTMHPLYVLEEQWGLRRVVLYSGWLPNECEQQPTDSQNLESNILP